MSETKTKTCRRCTNLGKLPTELLSKPELKAKYRWSQHGCRDLENFRLVGIAQLLRFPVIIHLGGFMHFMNQNHRGIVQPSERSPPAQSLALCSIYRQPAPRSIRGAVSSVSTEPKEFGDREPMTEGKTFPHPWGSRG